MGGLYPLATWLSRPTVLGVPGVPAIGGGNPSVTGGYLLWTEVRRKGKGPPWPGGPGGPLGTLRRWFLRGPGGGQGLRLLWRKLSPFPGAMGFPADASGAYRPNPQATTKLAPRPSSLKGYPCFSYCPCKPPQDMLRKYFNKIQAGGSACRRPIVYPKFPLTFLSP